MSRFLALTLFLLSLLTAALAIPAMAEACSCAGPRDESDIPRFYGEGIKNSDAAIVAVVANKRIIDPDPAIGGEERAVYTLRVRRAFKRFKRFPEGSELKVRTSVQESACGLGMKEGAVAGLLLFRYRGRLQASLCGKTSPRNLRAGYRWLQDDARPLSGRSSQSRLRRVPCREALPPRAA